MKSFLWIFALIFTLGAAVYQRVTGPTYPLKHYVTIGKQKIQITLLRSHSTSSDCPVILRVPDITVNGTISFRKFPGKDEMVKIDLKREGDKLTGYLPKQPPAGKLEYRVDLTKNGAPLMVGKDTQVVIRFTGDVPEVILGIHIFLMFLAMFLSNITGLFALFKFRSYRLLAVLTFAILFAGGMVMGPIVQKYAFNEYWTGAPFGWDLTDNKTLIAILAWLLAMVMLRKKTAAIWIIAASLITIIIFSIPHSLYGSQLNQKTGKIIQGTILPLHL